MLGYHKKRYSKPRFELAEILNRYFADYAGRHGISTLQQRVVNAIQNCRTSRLGGHIWQCNECDYQRQEYNSCRNRHCPKCQISKKVKWVQDRLDELLPIPYYHMVFTMPHSLNPLALFNKEVVYDNFFKSAGYALNLFAADPRFLGARLGFTGILHTWGQALTHHVHLHFIITGGGLSADGTRWLKLPYRKKFLFPVKAVSKLVRKRFAELMQADYDAGKLTFPDELRHLEEPAAFRRFLDKVAWENWNSYVKKPFAGPQEVVEYIGRYTHRIAISNHRLLDIEEGKVTFRYKKYHNDKVSQETMQLGADEFIRRFLLHVIPRGFKRIRHFGFLANGCKTDSIALARQLLSDMAEKLAAIKTTFEDWLDQSDSFKCPSCETGILQLSAVLLEPG